MLKVTSVSMSMNVLLLMHVATVELFAKMFLVVMNVFVQLVLIYWMVVALILMNAMLVSMIVTSMLIASTPQAASNVIVSPASPKMGNIVMISMNAKPKMLADCLLME